jgi:MoaA/NifB/PqqE/SkfB family radical SAM enzyme
MPQKQYSVYEFKTLIGNNKLFLYGAGKRGRMWARTFRNAGIEISGFVDAKEVGGDIIRPDFIPRNAFVCISTIDMHVKEIAKRLESMGFKRDADFISASQTCIGYPTIEVSGVCNLHCQSCNLGSPLPGRTGGLMPLKLFNEILNKLTREIPIMPFISLFLWGEPLLNPDLPEMIVRCNNKGISVDVSTNLQYGKHLERVIEAGPSNIAIPCSGVGTNYEMTHRGGRWKTFRDNLFKVHEYIERYKVDTSVQVSYHLYKSNLGEDYDYVSNLVHDLGFMFKPVIANLFPERLLEFVAYGIPIPKDMMEISQKMLYSVEEQIATSRKGINKDVCAKVYPTIRWDGSVVACYNMEGGEIARNFLDVPLEELNWRRMNSKLCTDCKKFDLQYLFFPDDKKELLRSVQKRGEVLQKKEILERGNLC